MPQEDDALLERALEIALCEPEGWRRLMPELVAENPETRVADLAAAIARAALAVEETFADGERDGLPGRLYRLAALAALEASTMARRGWADARAADLSLYRRIHADAVLGDALSGR